MRQCKNMVNDSGSKEKSHIQMFTFVTNANIIIPCQ